VKSGVSTSDKPKLLNAETKRKYEGLIIVCLNKLFIVFCTLDFVLYCASCSVGSCE
jgi:hypothetical protein